MVFTRESQLGVNNTHWKPENTNYNALHRWIRINLSIPESCEECHKIKPLDATNITGIYKRDASNWKFLCRSCHLKHDYKTGLRYRHAKIGLEKL